MKNQIFCKWENVNCKSISMPFSVRKKQILVVGFAVISVVIQRYLRFKGSERVTTPDDVVSQILFLLLNSLLQVVK